MTTATPVKRARKAAAKPTTVASQIILPGQFAAPENAWYSGIMPAGDGKTGWNLWLPEGKEFTLSGPWGEYGQNVKGADSDFDGLANTQAMAKAGCPLAVRALELGGYIPAPRESALLFAMLKEQFEARWHWTSKQYSSSYAWGQTFSSGGTDNGTKKFEARSRVVRRSVLQSFNPSIGVGA